MVKILFIPRTGIVGSTGGVGGLTGGGVGGLTGGGGKGLTGGDGGGGGGGGGAPSLIFFKHRYICLFINWKK